jgi:CRISPR-associated Csx10 family RAMP protein
MPGLRVDLRLLAPTCIAQRPITPGQVATSLGYLTGTALRGALATRWLAGRPYVELDGVDRDRVRRLFLDGQVRFGAAWPVHPGGATWVVPQTAWTAKHNGGWRHEGDAGVRDVLAGLLRDAPDDHDAQRELERLDDEFAFRETWSQGWLRPHLRRRLITRTALNRIERPLPSTSLGVAVSGQLYTMETLETGQEFAAVIRGPQDRLDELRQRALTADATLSLGRGRSRGSGEAAIRRIETIPDDARDAAELELLAQAFSRRAGASGGIAYLPVTLESDVILRDRYLLPCSSGEPGETLSRYLPGVPASMRPRLAIQRTRWISGWDAIRRLPRSPQLAVQLGSVWVFAVPDAELPAAIAWWFRAERQGLGEWRNRGFGQVRLFHPLHAEDERTW